MNDGANGERRIDRRTLLRSAAVGGAVVGATGAAGGSPDGDGGRSDAPTEYQVDFAAGEPIEQLGEDGLYAEEDRLMRFAFGSTSEGITEKDTAWPSAEIRDCVEYGHIVEDDGTASVRFTVADDCDETTLSLAVYSMPSDEFSADTADEQELLGATTGTYEPGDHTITVDLPSGADDGGASGWVPPSGTTEYGRAVTVGDGRVRPFTTVTAAGEPRYHGVLFDRDALVGLPSADELAAAADDAETDKYRAGGQARRIHRRWSREYFVPFPAAEGTPFTFLGLNWNPNGHPGGDGAWGVPHFDVHFHTLDPATVDAVEGPTAPPYDDIPSERVPEGYVRGPAVDERYVTDMGEHLAPSDAPELPGSPEAFTATLVQGFVGVGDGRTDPRLAFVEPMVTREYLRGVDGTERFAVARPDELPHDLRHPTAYSVRDVPSADAVAVVLEAFE
ncbi:hypothetical protein [Candidatus Halobonum tyrrellensis]|uniref:Uncharacterized protein n=1 Tax=Candidatus Halobonum tyrrellensis G22 TaxID=1324957 RepID=V4HPY8_9EURY|nr:hypothetical protein [Candidatus Halobonum tyrrellensis]ESP89979.1 hypothetical protein K933_00412 [Candidatus Halobonum tyrrellensis G22]